MSEFSYTLTVNTLTRTYFFNSMVSYQSAISVSIWLLLSYTLLFSVAFSDREMVLSIPQGGKEGVVYHVYSMNEDVKYETWMMGQCDEDGNRY